MQDQKVVTRKQDMRNYTERFSFADSTYENNITKCQESLMEKFGSRDIMWKSGALSDLAVSHEMLNWLRSEMAFTLKESADLSNLEKYLISLVHQYCNTEVESSTSMSRELEAKAKREVLKLKIKFMIQHFNFEKIETVNAIIGFMF